MGIWKSPSMQYRRDKVAVKTTCIKYIKLKIIKIRTGCLYIGYLYYSKNLLGRTKSQNLRLGRGLDIAGIDLSGTLKNWINGFFPIKARCASALAVAFFA